MLYEHSWQIHTGFNTHTFQSSETSLQPFLSVCFTRLQNAGAADGAGGWKQEKNIKNYFEGHTAEHVKGIRWQGGGMRTFCQQWRPEKHSHMPSTAEVITVKVWRGNVLSLIADRRETHQQHYYNTFRILILSPSCYSYERALVSLLSTTTVTDTFTTIRKFFNSVFSHRPLLSFPGGHCSTGSRDSVGPGSSDEAWRYIRCQVWRDKPGRCSLSQPHFWPEHQTVREKETGHSKVKINLKNYS